MQATTTKAITRRGRRSQAVIAWTSPAMDNQPSRSPPQETRHPPLHLARMEQLASPTSILLTPSTLALVEGYVAVKPLGPVPVKGLEDAGGKSV